MSKAVTKSGVLSNGGKNLAVEISPDKWRALETVAAVLGESAESMVLREAGHLIDNITDPAQGFVESLMDGATYDTEQEAKEAAARVNAYRLPEYMPFDVEPVEDGAGWRVFDTRSRFPVEIVCRQPMEDEPAYCGYGAEMGPGEMAEGILTAWSIVVQRYGVAKARLILDQGGSTFPEWSGLINGAVGLLDKLVFLESSGRNQPAITLLRDMLNMHDRFLPKKVSHTEQKQG